MAEKKEFVMTEDVAEDLFSDWAEDNEIDTNVSKMNEDDQASFNLMKKRFVKALMKGNLVVDEDGLEYTITSKSPEGYAGTKLTITPPDGAAYMKTDNFKREQGIHKTVAMMASITGKDVKFFANLANEDFKFMQAAVNFFITD